LINLTPQFAEVRETGSSHPDDEVLVFHVKPLDGALSPFEGVVEFIINIRLPGNATLVNSNSSLNSSVFVLN
jgi:hypothetical protein